TYDDAGRLAEALPLYEEVLKQRQVKVGPDHAATLTAMKNLAKGHRGAGRPTEAPPLMRGPHGKSRRPTPPPPVAVAESLSWLGWVLSELGQAEEAEPLLREGLALREKHLPAGHWFIANTRSVLGDCLARQHKFADAESLLLQGYQGMVGAKEIPPIRLREAVERVVRLYTAWEKQDKAAEWRKKLAEAEQPVKPQ